MSQSQEFKGVMTVSATRNTKATGEDGSKVQDGGGEKKGTQGREKRDATFIHSFIFIYLGTVAPSVHEN